jgi:hypothetical protein
MSSSRFSLVKISALSADATPYSLLARSIYADTVIVVDMSNITSRRDLFETFKLRLA